MRFYKTAIAIATCAALSACGGSSDSNEEKLEIDFSYSTISIEEFVEMDELSTKVIPILSDYNGRKTLTYTLKDFESKLITATVSDAGITINAGDIVLEKEAEQLILQVSDGVSTKELKMTLFVDNTSYKDSIDRLNNDFLVSYNILMASEQDVIMTYALDKAYLSQTITHSKRKAIRNTYIVEGFQDSRKAIQSVLDEAVLASKEGPESFEKYMADDYNFEEEIKIYTDYTISAFDYINELDISSVPEINVDELHQIGDRYSFFYGNKEMGSYGADDKWVFVDQYDIFNKLIPGGSQICMASDSSAEETIEEGE